MSDSGESRKQKKKRSKESVCFLTGHLICVFLLGSFCYAEVKLIVFFDHSHVRQRNGQRRSTWLCCTQASSGLGSAGQPNAVSPHRLHALAHQTSRRGAKRISCSRTTPPLYDVNISECFVCWPNACFSRLQKKIERRDHVIDVAERGIRALEQKDLRSQQKINRLEQENHRLQQAQAWEN